jgi:hypothetical protein
MTGDQVSVRQCDVCGEPGADACIRMASGSPGERRRPIFGHAECAKGLGIIPLYPLTAAPGGAASTAPTDTAMALDISAVRAATLRLLAKDAAHPGETELAELARQLRGYIVIAVPDVRRAASRHPRGAALVRRAEAGVGEALRTLDAVPMAGPEAAVAFARRLARVVNALLDHHENLTRPLPSGPARATVRPSGASWTPPAC